MVKYTIVMLMWLLCLCVLPAEDWLVQDFDQNAAGDAVRLSVSKNNSGTICRPDPFQLSAGGCDLSPSRAVHVSGKLGANRAPWSWVQIQIPLQDAPVDCSRFKSIRFYAKGNGSNAVVRLCRAAVKDHAWHQVSFETTGEWQRYEFPLDMFRQAWGKKLPADFTDVTQIQFAPLSYNEEFDLWIDHVVLSTRKAQLQHDDYSDSSWFPFQGIDSAVRAGTALDMSHLLDAPAGKHGWLRCADEDFVFESGKRIRFWGINIVASANFPTHAEAERMAALLAQMGVNMTRHHHMDAFWTNPNIFGNSGSTLKLDAEALDRFDYLVAQLQQRGIYQYLDFLVNRKAYAADGIAVTNGLGSGWKIEGMFDPKLIELQEQFIRQLLTHKNPYTGKTYGEDPACCLMEIVNEDSLFFMQPKGGFAVEDAYYRKGLNRQFSMWLQEQYSDDKSLAEVWRSSDDKRHGLQGDESLTDASVDALIAFGRGPDKQRSAQRNRDTLRFYYEITLNYYQRLKQVIRDCGSQAPVAGSNHWSHMPADLLANAQLDYIDRHSYWAHPQGGFNMARTTHNHRPMVKDRGLGLIRSLAGRRVLGKPYIITEWQAAVPNDYRADAQLIMGAVGSFQNWSAIQFAWSHSNQAVTNDGSLGLGIFDVLRDPNMLAIWHPVALMIHRGDVRQADLEQAVAIEISRDSCFDPSQRLRLPQTAALEQAIGIRFGERDHYPFASENTERRLISNSHGEMHFDQRRGLFSVDTARTQGFCGFTDGKEVTLGTVTLRADNAYALMLVSSLDNQPLSQSKHMLVTTLGRSINTGMQRHAHKDRMHAVGEGPVRIERISGSVRLKRPEWADTVEAWYLDHNGQRIQHAALRGAQSSFSISCGNADASFIEVIIK